MKNVNRAILKILGERRDWMTADEVYEEILVQLDSFRFWKINIFLTRRRLGDLVNSGMVERWKENTKKAYKYRIKVH